MSKVFIVETPKAHVNLSAAEKYGEIVRIFPDTDKRCHAYKAKEYGDSILQRISEMGFDFEKDYICIAGAFIPVIFAVCAAACAYESINVLMFNPADETYISRVIGYSQWQHEIERIAAKNGN